MFQKIALAILFHWNTTLQWTPGWIKTSCTYSTSSAQQLSQKIQTRFITHKTLQYDTQVTELQKISWYDRDAEQFDKNPYCKPLFAAISRQDKELSKKLSTIETLIQNNEIDINYEHKPNIGPSYTALMLAVSIPIPQQEIIQKLIELGADPNKKCAGDTAISRVTKFVEQLEEYEKYEERYSKLK
jgi:hypothetical protein